MPYGADRRNDPRVMRELFVEDAVWHSEGFGVFRGRSEIIAGLREIASTRVSRTLNYMIPPLVDIASDRRQRPRSLASLGTRAFEGRARVQVRTGYGWGRLHLQAGPNRWPVALSTYALEYQHGGSVLSDRYAVEIATPSACTTENSQYVAGCDGARRVPHHR
jgi:SnoaL-like domain